VTTSIEGSLHAKQRTTVYESTTSLKPQNVQAPGATRSAQATRNAYLESISTIAKRLAIDSHSRAIRKTGGSRLQEARNLLEQILQSNLALRRYSSNICRYLQNGRTHPGLLGPDGLKLPGLMSAVSGFMSRGLCGPTDDIDMLLLSRLSPETQTSRLPG
jgi:hypothetical protein